jgi:transposase InsO family protein
MKELGIRSIQRKRRQSRITSKLTLDKYSFPNELKRNFKSTRKFEKLCTDITEFHFNNRILYLSSIIDLYNNKIVAYQYNTKPTTKFVLETVKQISNDIKEKCILHSDRGSQYTSYAYKKLLKNLKLDGSMSRPGKCLDNSPIENFHSQIKCELQYKHIKDIDKMKEAIDNYIKFYNYERVQHKLKTPPEYYSSGV